MACAGCGTSSRRCSRRRTGPRRDRPVTRLDSFAWNIYWLARHVVATQRYGLDARLAAQRVVKSFPDPNALPLDDLAVVILAVLKVYRERRALSWQAVLRAQLLAHWLLDHSPRRDRYAEYLDEDMWKRMAREMG